MMPWWLFLVIMAGLLAIIFYLKWDIRRLERQLPPEVLRALRGDDDD